MIDSRRDSITTSRTSPDTLAPGPRVRSQSGMTMWFDTMVDTAIAATITIDVAELNPPRKDSTASASCPCDSGTVSTKRSGFAPAGSSSSPATAIGTMKRLMSMR